MKFLKLFLLSLSSLFIIACSSSSPKDITINFIKDLFKGDAKAVMTYLDLSEVENDKEKQFVSDTITQSVAYTSAKAKQNNGIKNIEVTEKEINENNVKMRVLVIFNNDQNTSTNVFLTKKDGKWLVKLK